MIKLEKITQKFNDFIVLKDINYIFNKKKYLIIGPSGVGKTTLLKIINEELIPTFGSVTCTLKIGMIYQDYNLLNSFSVKENIEIAMKIQKINTNYSNIIDLLNISHILNKFPSEISGGEKQRVAIARTLAVGAEIILADEPTGNLDQENAKNIISIFNLINSELNIGFIVSSHDILWNDFANITLKINNGNLTC